MAEAHIFSASMEHIKGMLGVLQCVRQNKKQTATLVVDKHGLLVYTYDDSRTMQGCAHFRREVFRDFSFTPPDQAFRKCFSASLSNLVDSLGVFAASDGQADVQLAWPDRDGRLLLQLNALRDTGAEEGAVDSCTYAEVSCEEALFAEDLEGEMTQPRSQFTLPSATLREVVEDLEWAGAPVCVALQRQPPGLCFSAHGAVVGDVKVVVDTGAISTALQSFECVGDSASSRFKFKFLRAAACMPAALTAAGEGPEGSLSRVHMDGQGMLKVQHLLQIVRPHAGGARGGGGGGGGGGGAHGGVTPSLDSLADPSPSVGVSGRGAGGVACSSTAPVTFILFPEEIDLDEAGLAPEEGRGGTAATMPGQPGARSPEL